MNNSVVEKIDIFGKAKNFSRDFFLKQKFFQLSKINSLSLWIMVNVAFYVKVGRDYALVFFTK